MSTPPPGNFLPRDLFLPHEGADGSLGYPQELTESGGVYDFSEVIVSTV